MIGDIDWDQTKQDFEGQLEINIHYKFTTSKNLQNHGQPPYHF
jgi:hypothetical protein